MAMSFTNRNEPCRKCRHCRKTFRPKSPNSFYCSDQCRFWSKVKTGKNDECWPWLGRIDIWGYGYFTVGLKEERAHRVAWEFVYGKIPAGKIACHQCDTPDCCNPRHIFIGTHADNAKDKMKKGRHRCPKGSKHFKAKLTEKDVRQIKQMLNDGLPQRKIALAFNVRHAAIGDIYRGITWKHV